tara:strand:- start:4169 stop:4564 length:396 start_codon:yes stop_codon:yes gene_type:complete
MELVENEEKYWEFIRTLRNMGGVREGFVQQTYITSEVHEKHLKKYGHLYYICIEDNIPMGYVGAIGDDIRVATHPIHQKKGVGKFMINQLAKRHPEATAKIKIDNVASIALFEGCDFVKRYYILERETDAS